MAKYQLRLKARQFRDKGLSIKNIAYELGVSKSSVSFWVRDIILTPDQLKALKQSEHIGKQAGRLKIIAIKQEKRKKLLEEFKNQGAESIPTLTKSEFMLTGLALYWAEGGKSIQNRRVEFCNSDPRMVKFLTLWLKETLHVKDEDLRAVVGINQVHSKREDVVKQYWSDITGIPLTQFRKTSFKKVESKKVYDNFDVYYGTLSVLVVKSTNLYYKIMGQIERLAHLPVNNLAG